MPEYRNVLLPNGQTVYADVLCGEITVFRPLTLIPVEEMIDTPLTSPMPEYEAYDVRRTDYGQWIGVPRERR